MNKRRIKKVDLAALDATREEDIDYSEIPELDDAFFANAVRMPNGFDLSKMPARPHKTAVSLRLDDDVLAWLKAAGPGYQSRINQVLRGLMVRSARPRKKPARATARAASSAARP